MKKEWDRAAKTLMEFGEKTSQYVVLTLSKGRHSSGEHTIYYRAYSADGGWTEECTAPMDAVIECMNKYKEVSKRA
jgi:hypothetical protein